MCEKALLPNVSADMESSTRLDACGWSSIDPLLFAGEASRVERNVGPAMGRMLRDFSRGRRVLDLCCGTGHLCIHLAREGYEVTGVDLSQGMLQIFQASAAQEGPDVRARIHIVQADVCSLNLGSLFDFVILEDDSFVYFHTREDQLACLLRVREHLAQEGLFFLQFTTPQRELLADEEYEYDELRQIKSVNCQWTIFDTCGVERQVTQGVQRRRLTWPEELEQLLQASGLEVLHRWGDLERTPFKEPDFQEYCYLMRAS